MTAKRETKMGETLTPEEAQRKAVVDQMLAERELRQTVSREELTRMRDPNSDGTGLI